MNIPTDRLLIMVVVVTAFAVLFVGWAGGLVEAEAVGLNELGLQIGLAAVFLVVIAGIWYQFSRIDEERGDR
ncbi:hypothetical protein [Halopiger aswanensis]|uniref:Uncharacterized protein n=1 Tax=Halopiger aswanensis TaxID=148449 RepID=A0A419WI04_9EURY|nr:hypothetical protein [Halopiger aswanensis]RKD95043.1 hypothetical protein ATJ93_1893 [Halopiger aswanensis]